MAGGHDLEHMDHCEQKGGCLYSGKGTRDQDYSIVGEEKAQWQMWRKGLERGSTALTGC